jgi:hypothetical protein
MLYGLRHSPRHWYDKINAILWLIGLTPLLKDPFYTGFVHDLSDPLSIITSALLSLGLYGSNFVYFSKDPEVETLFCCLLAKHCKVDFMGVVEWFFGVHFSWCITHSSVNVHLNQSGFAMNLVKSFACQAHNETLMVTLY